MLRFRRSARLLSRSCRSCSRAGSGSCAPSRSKAMVIGAFVRGLSMRDAESLCEQAGLGHVSKSTASWICKELRERFAAFRARDLWQIKLVALFLDAIYLPVRPSGAKEGVLCAWGISESGERVLLAVMLGMRESEEDWLALGRDLTRRGLPCPQLIVSDGAPGLIGAIEQCWTAADRQRCTVDYAESPVMPTWVEDSLQIAGSVAWRWCRHSPALLMDARASITERRGVRWVIVCGCG